MNYCTLEDAWKYSDSLTEQFKLKKNIETFTSENNNSDYDYDFKLDNDFIDDITKDINSTKDINNNIYHRSSNNNKNIHASSDYNDAFICDDFLDHLETCKICRSKMRKRFKSNIIERIENLIIDNKDAILLLLLILFALIFCNLIILIFK